MWKVVLMSMILIWMKWIIWNNVRELGDIMKKIFAIALFLLGIVFNADAAIDKSKAQSMVE